MQCFFQVCLCVIAASFSLVVFSASIGFATAVYRFIFKIEE